MVADGTLVSADGLAVDQSNLTGESEFVASGEGEPVWSGSFAVEGVALFEAEAVGRDSRAERLTATARAFRHPRSPLERANDRLLLGLVVLSVPLAVGLIASVLTRVHGGNAHVQAIVAGLATLIPEGLILLLSLTAAVSAYLFARRGVLAQQLNAIESLASVDVLCTDKTGTLTGPGLRVVGVVPAAGVDEHSLGRELARYAASSPSRNQTLEAIGEAGLGESARARFPGRFRSPLGGAGACSISATSVSCWKRRSGSPTRTVRSRSGHRRRRLQDGACSRSVV